MAVGEREDRLGLREDVEVELALAHRPRIDVVGAVAITASSSARSETTTSRAVLLERVRLADAIDADDEPELPRPPRLDPRQRVLEHGGLLWLHAELARGLPGTCPAPGLPRSSNFVR